MGQSSSSQVSTNGYHVLKVIPGSPAHDCGLEPYFDYILFINGIRLDQESTVLVNNLQNNIDNSVTLIVYSTKTRSLRDVLLTPKQWSTDTQRDGILGCTVKFCDYQGMSDHIWHVLQVYPNSPAYQAGLVSHKDYILGTPHSVLKQGDDLFELVERHVGKPLQLYVYNSDQDCIREVLILPNNDWGGEGLLGCDIGYGFLHRIPTHDNDEQSDTDQQKQLVHEYLDDDYEQETIHEDLNETS